MTKWPYMLDVVTVADVMDYGACWDGVREWLAENPIIVGSPRDFPEEEQIQRAARSDGYGVGSGSGSGVGSGDGYGSFIEE